MNYTLYDLQEHLRRVVALNFPEAVWIQCEIASYNESRGHHFLSVLEKGEGEREILAQADAVIWERQYRRIRKKLGKEVDQLLQNGRQIQLKARLDFHERYGMKLIVEELDLAFTLGQLAQQRQYILEQLTQEQLLHKNSQIQLPPVLQRLAVISAKQAAGWHDFQEQLADNKFGYQFDYQLFEAAMQGINTRDEVSKQLRKIKRSCQAFDAVLILRGGGARLDLSSFDDYELGKAIANFPLPVFTGIGHEIDESVADKVAHTALRTPTAAADFLIQHNYIFEQRLLQTHTQINRSAQIKLQQNSAQLSILSERLHWLGQQQIQRQQARMHQLQTLFPVLVRQHLQRAEQHLSKLQQIQTLLSLEQTLKRGFALVAQHDQIITQVGQLQENVTFKVQLQDGAVTAKIEE